jgi:hypothetical protein
MRSLRPLVRHFLGSLLGRGVLEDDGVEGVRGLMFGAVAGLLSIGFMLPRQFSRIYLELSYLPDPEPFRTALTADSLFMLTLPFLVALVAAALVAPSMFPDEVDYLSLVPLPISRRRIFVAKAIALAIFVGALVLSLAAFAAIAFPMFTHHRWAQGHFTHRIAAHGIAAAGSGLLGFGIVVAIQGLCTMWAPRRWLPTLAVLVPSAIVTGVILALPFVLQLPTQREWIATEPPALALFPPAWFVGFERVLLGIAAPYWQRMAWTGALGAAVVVAAGAIAYTLLYRHFERLVLPPPRERPQHEPITPRVEPPMDARGFARATLFRHRLPLLLFLVFGAMGVGLVTWSMLQGFLADSFRWDEPVPSILLEAVIALPLVLMLSWPRHVRCRSSRLTMCASSTTMASTHTRRACAYARAAASPMPSDRATTANSSTSSPRAKWRRCSPTSPPH